MHGWTSGDTKPIKLKSKSLMIPVRDIVLVSTDTQLSFHCAMFAVQCFRSLNRFSILGIRRFFF